MVAVAANAGQAPCITAWRQAVDAPAAWFGILESDCVSLGLLSNRKWAGLHSPRLDDGDWREVMAGMLARIGVPAGIAGSSPPLYLAGDAEAPASAPGLDFSWLQPPAGSATPLSRMALGL